MEGLGEYRSAGGGNRKFEGVKNTTFNLTGAPKKNLWGGPRIP